MLLEKVNDASSKLHGLFDVRIMRSLLDEHGPGSDKSGMLWAFSCWEYGWTNDEKFQPTYNIFKI